MINRMLTFAQIKWRDFPSFFLFFKPINGLMSLENNSTPNFWGLENNTSPIFMIGLAIGFSGPYRHKLKLDEYIRLSSSHAVLCSPFEDSTTALRALALSPRPQSLPYHFYDILRQKQKKLRLSNRQFGCLCYTLWLVFAQLSRLQMEHLTLVSPKPVLGHSPNPRDISNKQCFGLPNLLSKRRLGQPKPRTFIYALSDNSRSEASRPLPKTGNCTFLFS